MKYVYVGLVVLVLAGATTVAVWQWRESVRYQNLLNASAEELQKANLEIGRAHTEILDQSALHEKAMRELSDTLQAEIKARKALVTMYAQLEASYRVEQSKANSIATAYEDLIKTGSFSELPIGKLFYKKDDNTLASVKSIKWTYGDFRIDLAGEATADGLNPDKSIKIAHVVDYKIHLRFKARVIRTTTPNNIANHYGELYELDPNGKELGKLELTSFEVVESNTLASKMMWWDPKLDIGIGFGMNTTPNFVGTADVGFSAMAYGKTKYDIDWRFLRVGIGFTDTKNAVLTFSPAMYNFGKKLPLLSNLWLTPSVGLTLPKPTPTFTLGTTVVF